MRGRRTEAVLICLSALALSCSTQQQQGLSDEFYETLSDLRERRAVEQAVELQAVSPETEEAERRLQPRTTLEPGETLWIQSGKSRLVQLRNRIKRVSIADPDAASVIILGQRSFMINAKEASPIGGGAATGAMLGGTGIGETVVQGQATPPQFRETTMVIWTIDANRREVYDIHTLVIADFMDKQVMLEVTVAELNRTQLEQYGIEWRVFREDFFGAGFLGAGGGGMGTLPTPLGLLADPEQTTFAFIWPDENVSILLQALQTEGLANILAQPKLLAMSGQSALFQSGGEIPIRTSTGFAAEVEFKDFGTLITFTPTVMESGDIILTVTPEVSQADFANLVEGIPTFRTRRASTSARLRNGQTLVIGGLLQTSIGEEEEGVPYLKDIPLVGRAFSTTTYDTEVQELMVIVRPRLVEPLLPGTEVPLPVVAEPMQREDVRTKASPAKVTRPRVPGLP